VTFQSYTFQVKIGELSSSRELWNLELFSANWFAAGVVDAESAADFARFATASPDRPARHWRWLAFRDWSESRERLTADECRAAYAVGEAEAEADPNLGAAVMCHVLLQRNCPAELRDAARRSDLAAVRHAAARS
jgi:hypothetical protein